MPQNKLLQEAIDEIDIWAKKYDELKADYEQYVKDFDSLYTGHVALKAKAQKLAEALRIIQNWQLPPTGKFWDAEQKDPMSYEAAYGSNGARDFMKNVANQALQEWKEGKEGKQNTSKDHLIKLILAGAENVSKDKESAEEYLKSEGVDVKKVMEDGRYIMWKAELVKLVSEATGESAIKVNDIEARKWYDDGFTAYQCFRETWNME